MSEERNAIVTGASRGIGRAVVKRFAAAGMNLWACARHPSSEFETQCREYEQEFHVWIRPVYFDLMDEEQVCNGVKSILAEKKNINVLVNNAGIPHGGLMMMTPMEKLHEVFQVNYFSQILMIQLVSKRMIRQREGVIINMASAGGLEHMPGYLSYGGSKNAIIWATKTIAVELAEFGIRVNAVAPGLTDTNMGNYKDEKEREKTLQRTPLHRMATPEEIAEAVFFLAGQSSQYITGHILQVDGGRV